MLTCCSFLGFVMALMLYFWMPGYASTVVGGATSGFVNGMGTEIVFGNPNGVAVDSSGNVFVTDGNTNVIRKVNASGAEQSLCVHVYLMKVLIH
jgi:DNA-binding beta-propeller fold protein YncE